MPTTSSETHIYGSDDPVVTERFYDHELTGRQRLLKLVRRTLRSVMQLFGMAFLLAPLDLVALVTLDLPLDLFDGLLATDGAAASDWLSRGEGVLMLTVLVTLLMTRRWGSVAVGRAVTLAWALTLMLLAMLLVDLAPELEPTDFPNRRFAAALIVSWFIGQQVAAAIYDLTRGGAWWKAPFFGAALGYAVQALIYYPWAFVGTGAPWGWWLAVNLFLSTLIASAFVLFYGPLRRLVRPRLGLGGR